MLAGVQTHKDELISIDTPSQFNKYGRREKSVATLNIPPVTDKSRYNKPQTAEGGKRKSYFSSGSNEASSTLNSPRGPIQVKDKMGKVGDSGSRGHRSIRLMLNKDAHHNTHQKNFKN